MRPPWPYRLPSRLGGDGTSRRRGGVSRGCWTSGASASSSTPGSRSAPRGLRAPRGCEPPTTRRARARRRADAVRARRRRGPERVRPRLPRRSADRGGDPPSPLAPSEAAPVAVGGARLGGHRAADRGAPRGADPAPDREALGRALPARRTAATGALARAWPAPDVPTAAVVAGVAPAELACLRPRAVARDRADPLRSRGRRRPRRPPDRPGTGGCCDPGIGPWTLQVLGSAAAASPTRCPPATSPTSSSSACSRLGRRARRSPGVEEYFAPYAPFRGLAGTSPSSAGTAPSPRAAARPAARELDRPTRRGSAASSSLVSSSPAREAGDQALVGEEAGEALPLASVHVAEGLDRSGQEQRQGGLDLGHGSARVEAVAGGEDRCRSPPPGSSTASRVPRSSAAMNSRSSSGSSSTRSELATRTSSS